MEDVTPSESYDIDSLESGPELTRLELQASAALDLELSFLRRFGLPPDATVIDLACGPGLLSRHLARMVPEGRVVGVDADQGLLAQAEARVRAWNVENCRFVHAWASDVPIQSGYADLVYSRFLMQHLPDPREVLREAYRVLRPGGRALLLDTDDIGLAVYPEPAGLRQLVEASGKARERRRGGDRNVGRKLKSALAREGFTSLRVELIPFTSEMVGLSTFIDICFGFKRQIIEPSEMSPAEVEDVLAELRALVGVPGVFAQALVYAVSGQRPG